ncbi:MAG TPA: TolC family protein [Candidatus Acidoferrales bacterium]|nr:TolC family protein [Candidatus Acidoferrales bacterium]
MSYLVVDRRRVACIFVFAAITVGFRIVAAADLPTSASNPEASDPTAEKLNITFDEFLDEVVANNLDYAAQRYNVSIAEANITAASVFQNPTLALGGVRDVSHSGHERMPDSLNGSLTQTFELGGKRKYRILGARQTHAATAATLDDFLRNLRLDAAAAFADALAQARSADQKRLSAEYLNDLAATQMERRRVGDISQADMLQTQVEAQQFQNDLLGAQAEAESASLALNGFLGRNRDGVRLVPAGNLDLPARDFDLSTLLAEARESRSDLIALRYSRDAAQSKVQEERANRIPNVDIGPAWTHGGRSDNSIAPSPQFDAVGLSFSLPIPLWNRNDAAIAAAHYAADQAQKQLDAAELKVDVELRQAFSAYRSAGKRVHQYQNGILKDADSVLDARRFSYQRGQSTLLELLDAQRTANEVRSNYTAALADNAKALIELERAAGIWEIEF